MIGKKDSGKILQKHCFASAQHLHKVEEINLLNDLVDILIF